MPSARRMRLAFVGVMAIVVMTLVYTSQLRQSQNPDVRTFGDFYGRTKSGLERARGGQQQQQQQSVLDSKGGTNKGDGDSDDAQLAKEMSDRLKAAEQKAKDSANAKAPRPDAPEKVIGVGNSAAGQDKSKDKAGNQLAEKETDEDHEVEIIINDILKKSPGKSVSNSCLACAMGAYTVCSHNFLQDLLPILQAGKGPSSRQVCHHTRALRCRAGHPSARQANTRQVGKDDRPEDGAKHHDQRQEHWWCR